MFTKYSNRTINCICVQKELSFYVAVTEESSILTSNVSSLNKQSSYDHTSVGTSPIPTYHSDFEDNTIATATNATPGVSTVGSGDPHTVKSDTKKDTVTDHVSEDISSEGDTLVEQHNSSQLDSTLQNGKVLLH